MAVNPLSMITSLLQPQQQGIPGGAAQQPNAGALSFSDLLKSGVENVREAQMQSEVLSAKAVMGEADMTQVVQSVAKAEVMLQTMVSVRDRLLGAYQELMNTRI